MLTTEPTSIAPPAQSHASPPITIILTTIILVIFFIGFFAIYFCRCFMQNVFYTWNSRHNTPGTQVGGPGGCAPSGLDPLIISTFPTFIYSNVKDFRRETYGLECAICLCEFEDDSVLRLLTKCYHVFHQDCIDLWLESHKSCPFCRCSLETPISSPAKSPLPRNITSMHEIQENELLEDRFVINIREENERNNNTDTKEENIKGQHVMIEIDQQDREDSKRSEKFSRNNSTGHSIAKNTKASEYEDRFTLRLPEHIRAKLIYGHNLTRSCTEFGEFIDRSSSGNIGFGEVSTSNDVHKLQVKD